MKKNETTITAEPGKQELFIIREFDAPRELVYKVFTDPELIPQWLGCRDMEVSVEKYESRAGGSYRYFHTMGEQEFGFNGVFHECTAPERIIQTFEFEGLPEKGHVCLETTRLEILPGDRTRVVIQDLFQSVSDRDGAVASGMETGIRESYERVDELLEKALIQ